jgi:hypothetical protein
MEEDSDQNCDESCSTSSWLLVGFSGLFLTYILGYFIWRARFGDKIRFYERSILARWSLPLPGLKLCKLCRALMRSSEKRRMQHYDNFQSLKQSGERGCWCCWTVCKQFAVSVEDHDSPPLDSDPSNLKNPRLLLWFAEQTWTKTGYLDHLRQIGKCPSYMSLFNGLTDFTQDYFEYIFKPRPRACETHPSSNASFCLIKGWLESCNLHHRCYQGTGVKLPTRLIDVSAETPYLLTTSDLQGPYVSLSHCWGQIQPITTTIDTIHARVNGIPFETLPRMFQDAVHITRRLNIKYLWIDSLCIIQDSEEDWAREAAQMGDVYRHSFLTIFALDSKDCHEGILVERLPRVPSEAGSLDDDHSSNSPLSKNEHNRHKKDILKASPLCKRGWVLQERLLSPRILYYSTGEIFWECLACTARESEMGVKAYQPATYFHQRYECADVKNRLILPPGPNPSLPLSPPLDWHIIAVEYTRCHLTKQTDKLPAVSGLASIFSANTGYTYLAGIWKENFREGLLWYVGITENFGVRKSELAYRGPSWSWISLDCPILYATTQDGSHDTRPGDDSRKGIKLLDWNVQLLGLHPFGQIVSASVTVEAHFQTFTYQHCISSKRTFIYDINGSKLDFFFLDRPQDASSTRKSCAGLWVTQRQFQIGDCEMNNPPYFTWLYFLVIVPDIASQNSWRRIGLCRSLRDCEIFQDCPRVKIHLV